MRGIPLGEAYPVHALGPLQAVVEAVQDISQVPDGIAAQSALSVASLAVQGFADVETLGGDAPLSLFCLTIAESGERKSTCDRLLMRGVRDHERDLKAGYREAFAEYEIAREIWQGKRKRMLAEAAGADKMKAAGAEADLRALGPEPRPPLFPNVTAQEPTFEGLLKLYQIGRPALGLFSDEAGFHRRPCHELRQPAENHCRTVATLEWRQGEPHPFRRRCDGLSGPQDGDAPDGAADCRAPAHG